MDEISNKPTYAFPRYQTAQIIFHSLAQQIDHEKDKGVLASCKLLMARLFEKIYFKKKRQH